MPLIVSAANIYSLIWPTILLWTALENSEILDIDKLD